MSNAFYNNGCGIRRITKHFKTRIRIQCKTSSKAAIGCAVTGVAIGVENRNHIFGITDRGGAGSGSCSCSGTCCTCRARGACTCSYSSRLSFLFGAGEKNHQHKDYAER